MSDPWSSSLSFSQLSFSTNSSIAGSISPDLLTYYTNRRLGLISPLPDASWGPESGDRKLLLKAIKECQVAEGMTFKEIDWSRPRRDVESPKISPKGFTALVDGIDRPIEIGKRVVGKRMMEERKREEGRGKKGWRPPGRC